MLRFKTMSYLAAFFTTKKGGLISKLSMCWANTRRECGECDGFGDVDKRLKIEEACTNRH